MATPSLAKLYPYQQAALDYIMKAPRPLFLFDGFNHGWRTPMCIHSVNPQPKWDSERYRK